MAHMDDRLSSPSDPKKCKTEDEADCARSQSQFSFSSNLSLENIRLMLSEFTAERNWNQYHSPRNLMLALTGEVGELAEIFQWKGEVTVGVPELTAAERRHLGQEMADVMAYLVRLADQCRVDLPTAFVDKMHLNRQKYPADQVFGKSNKYTDYVQTNQD